MQKNQVSLTSLATAFARAYHSKNNEPKIFDDFLAYDFFKEEERLFMEQKFAESLGFYNPDFASSNPAQSAALSWVMENQLGSITLSRASYTENCLEEAVNEGVGQYVILGAGMDTFAFRKKKMLEKMHVFEVDHPDTQAFKINRLKELGWDKPERLHFISVDFMKENLVEALQRSPFDWEKVSFFSWLGVTYYLTREVVFDTLNKIKEIAPPGSSIVFDYLDMDAFIPEKAAKRIQLMLKIVERAGEPMKAVFDPSKLAGNLSLLGLNIKEHLSPADIEKRYFVGRTDDYHAAEHIHFAWAAM